ncbi:hypothetical protein NLG97_g7814 [Lecanicillium saksenae]|uniref:Uncharacterized protein n=1 Tax=Lecanicillium saksenae TaxID=468837 RepID=A0ACC1QMK6_9HYPO|nr:hypothetical protein NLG97_g7814 [Lecanicillium saksenae]
MKSFSSIVAGIVGLASVASATVQGFDVSNYQPNPNWAGAYSSGARFVMIKATEGTGYISPSFNSQYPGATNAGFIRGGYHFALPNKSSGAAQADYFLAHGGGWSGDGITLPGMLDIEYNPYGATCYGLSQSAMVGWINDFVEHYKARTSQYPIIYTTTDWWKTCTGNNNSFGNRCPLSLARYSSSVGELPAGWGFQTFWQNSDKYAYGGDSQIFNGAYSQLQKIARGS